MARSSMQVRRGYDIAKQAAEDLDPYTPTEAKKGIGRKYLDWRSEEAGVGKEIPIQYPSGQVRMEPAFSMKTDELTNPAKRLEHGMCLPLYLSNSYIEFNRAIAKAQHHAMEIAPARWYELQRADELSRFLARQDNSVLTKQEVGDLGEALRHVRIAQANVRTNMIAPLKKGQENVPYVLEGALSNAAMWGKATVAHGYRCREDEFLPPLLASHVKARDALEDEAEEADKSGSCTVM